MHLFGLFLLSLFILPSCYSQQLKYIAPTQDVSQIEAFYLYDPSTLKGEIIALCQFTKYANREEAKKILLKWGEGKVKEALISICDNPEMGTVIRERSLSLLGNLKDQSIIPYLGSYFRDSSFTIMTKTIVISALSKQGYARAVPYLGEKLIHSEINKDTWPMISGLIAIATNEAADYLVEFLEINKGYSVSVKIRKAINRIYDYNDGRSKRKMLKRSLSAGDEDFAWSVLKIYQPNTPRISLKFLRRVCAEAKGNQTRFGHYFLLLELRKYLDDEMTENENQFLERAYDHWN